MSMPMTRRPLSRNEQQAWARVARSVRPLAGAQIPLPPENAAEPSGPAPDQISRPGRQQNLAHAGQTDPARAGPARSPDASPPAHRGGEKRVRRGRVEIHARFDLHGHTQTSAHRALPGFLRHQRERGARCVLVITGKGRNGHAILKRNFLNWLGSADARALVSGWSQAHARHGGEGAFYVFLRRMV